LLFVACAPPARLRYLTHAPPEQRNFLKERLKPFEKKNRVVVEIAAYDDPADLSLRLSGRDSVPDLVEIPSDAAPALVRDGVLASLDAEWKAGEGARWRREFFLTDLARVGGGRYLLPRFLETRILVYSKSRVRDAAAKWSLQREEIDAALRRQNGRGLPADFRLEEDPAQWDFFDLFAAGWYWKSHETRGAKRGRIACPAGEGTDAVLALWDHGFRLGADSTALARMDGPGVHRLFQWQSLFSQEGVCHPATTRGSPDSPLLDLFAAGEVFLAETYPRTAWRIHGNGSVQLPGAARDPEDLGFATLPAGASPELDAAGAPRLEGGSGAATRIWWLAVPARSPAKSLALKLAGHLTEARFQIEECAGFGLVPARKDLLADLGLLYGGDWMEEAFQAAARQLLANRHTMGPRRPDFPETARLYSEAYQQICAARKLQSPQDIVQTLERSFAPRARRILGELEGTLSDAAGPPLPAPF
jgi:ABC-type glycerol-3-phosphate transport system substrate-binding protein